MNKSKKQSNIGLNDLQVEIFEATVFDLCALSRLFDAYRQFYRQPSDQIGARSFLKERLVKKDSIIYIALDGQGNPAGFVQLYPIFSSVSMKRSWLLNDLYVDPEFRGKGVSRLLISRCKELARESNAKGLLLETEKTNEVGLNLYPSEGFKPVVETRFFFWTCE